MLRTNDDVAPTTTADRPSIASVVLTRTTTAIPTKTAVGRLPTALTPSPLNPRNGRTAIMTATATTPWASSRTHARPWRQLHSRPVWLHRQRRRRMVDPAEDTPSKAAPTPVMTSSARPGVTATVVPMRTATEPPTQTHRRLVVQRQALSVTDGADAFLGDDTQWVDTDGDGYGDNPAPATDPDGCPTQFGDSTADRLGCPDTDGDTYSVPIQVTAANGADAFPNEASQWADQDGDGYGDNATGTQPDACPTVPGTSTEANRLGCPDGDGDGWADVDDAFPFESTQWNDTDMDGYGDNAMGRIRRLPLHGRHLSQRPPWVRGQRRRRLFGPRCRMDHRARGGRMALRRHPVGGR